MKCPNGCEGAYAARCSVCNTPVDERWHPPAEHVVLDALRRTQDEAADILRIPGPRRNAAAVLAALRADPVAVLELLDEQTVEAARLCAAYLFVGCGEPRVRAAAGRLIDVFGGDDE